MNPAERIQRARDAVRDFLTDRPNASLHDAMRWLNNQRFKNERLTLARDHAQEVYMEVRRAPAGQKSLPVIIKPQRQPVLHETRVNALPEALPQYIVDARVRPPRVREREVVHQRQPHGVRGFVGPVLHRLRGRRVRDGCQRDLQRFDGHRRDRRLLHEAARDAAGLPINFKHADAVLGVRVTRHPKEAMPDLVKPTDTTDPNDLLKGAGLKLKHLCALMKWSKVALTVNADGSMSYDATPAPVMAMKGEIKL